MKIAMMVRSYLESPVPNDIAYSPTSVAIAIAEGLAAREHGVTFFGPEGTHLQGVTTETCNVRPLATTEQQFQEMIATTDLFHDYVPSLYDQYMAKEMFDRASKGEFDALIFHHPESAMGLAELYPNVPVVYVLHDYLDDLRRQVIEMHQSPNQHFISISNNQRRNAPDLAYAATVYNGIDTDLFAYSNDAEDYLIFAGRITPDKGVKEAVQVAIKSERRLIITGQLLPPNYWYFDEHIKPYLNDKILYLGMIDKKQLTKYYQKAAALLAPVQWEEPFGLTMAESMACGTPVIAFRRGSVPELIKDGKTGYIVDNTADMIDAIDKIGAIHRQDCRHHAEENFTVDTMVQQYEAILHKIIFGDSQKPRTLMKSMRLLSGKIVDQLR